MDSGNYIKMYAGLSKAFDKSSSAENISALYDFAETLKADGSTEAKTALWRTYKLLALYQSAYNTFIEINGEAGRSADKKLAKELYNLKYLAESHGDNFSIKKPRLVAKTPGIVSPESVDPPLPVFRYIPDPIEAEIFMEAGEDKEIICECCGNPTKYYYNTMYSEEEVSYLCPWCISSGKAAEKYDGQFIQDAETIIDDEEKTKELFMRTPGYTSWQGEYWLTHCGDYCWFLGDVGTAELAEMGILAAVLEDYHKMSGYDIDEVREYLVKKGSMSGYLFQCMHCGKYRIWVDCD